MYEDTNFHEKVAEQLTKFLGGKEEKGKKKVKPTSPEKEKPASEKGKVEKEEVWKEKLT